MKAGNKVFGILGRLVWKTVRLLIDDPFAGMNMIPTGMNNTLESSFC